MKLEYFINKSNYIDNQIRNFKAELRFLADSPKFRNRLEELYIRKMEIQEEIKSLFKEKSLLFKQAHQAELFCVELEELKKALEKQCNTTISFKSASIKSYANTKMLSIEKAVEENPRFDLKVYSHRGDLNSMWINLRFNDVKCPKENLEDFFDLDDSYLSILYPYSFLELNTAKLEGIKLNLHPICLKNKNLAHAIFKCVNNKEKQLKTAKIIE